jgi:hypothetical protein
MKAFTASINIKAPADRVWSIITDAPNYPKWDPGVIRIEGRIAPGEQLTAYTKLSPNRAFPAKVTVFEPGRKMVWSGGMPLGLFKGVRTFTLAPKNDGSLDFTLREEFSGPLLPLMAGSLPDMTQTFQEFVAGLKAHAERP